MIDGAIKFIVSDGHGDTQTVVPVAYDPNNDLYISADQGGFEITNTHPGNSVYSELELSGNWSGSGKSLLNIIVADGPRVSGIAGIVTWPNDHHVIHEDITGDVVVILGSTVDSAHIDIEDINGVTASYSVVNGVITIPSADVQNALSRRLKLSLFISGDEYSYLIFLPQTESEEFPIQGRLKADGSVELRNEWVCTDFIDIEYADDIVYRGAMNSEGYICVAAYNDNEEYVKTLLTVTSPTRVNHIEPDGTYTKIRACSAESYTHYLNLHFPDE